MNYIILPRDCQYFFTSTGCLKISYLRERYLQTTLGPGRVNLSEAGLGTYPCLRFRKNWFAELILHDVKNLSFTE